MFHFILADIRRNWIGVMAVMLLVALATALGVTVTLQERALRLGSARAAAPFDLVVGAPGSETQLVLSAVFLQPAALQLLPPDILARLRADERVAAAVPVGFGDFVGGYPVIGVSRDAVGMLGGLADGEELTHLDDAIVGAQVTRDIGSSFKPFHGEAGTAGTVHGHVDYHVVGRLKPTGTPWDRAILVPIQSVWDVHADADHDAHAGGGAETAHGAHEGEDHNHAHEGEPASRPIDENALSDASNPGVPAIIVKPKSFSDAYNLRQEYRQETTLAVFPAEVLTRLYGTLGDARGILSAVAIGAQLLVVAAILMQVATHVLQRRRQIGALRAFGAPRTIVLLIVWLETFAVLACGLLLGFGIGYGAASILSDRLGAMSGIVMPVIFQQADLWTLAAFLAVAAAATLLPALIAYRQTPAEALRS